MPDRSMEIFRALLDGVRALPASERSKLAKEQHDQHGQAAMEVAKTIALALAEAQRLSLHDLTMALSAVFLMGEEYGEAVVADRNTAAAVNAIAGSSSVN